MDVKCEACCIVWQRRGVVGVLFGQLKVAKIGGGVFFTF